MARRRLLDYMQVYQFWLVDVTYPSVVLLPVFGFSNVTAPRITNTVTEVKPGNQAFPRKVVTSSAVDPIMLTRGVQFFDNDFWRWIASTAMGDTALQVLGTLPTATIRKNLLLIHFTGYSPVKISADNPLSALSKVPGKAWMLYDCIPTAYKAGSDFDASSSAISLQELEIQPEEVEEFSIGV